MYIVSKTCGGKVFFLNNIRIQEPVSQTRRLNLQPHNSLVINGQGLSHNVSSRKQLFFFPAPHGLGLGIEPGSSAVRDQNCQRIPSRIMNLFHESVFFLTNSNYKENLQLLFVLPKWAKIMVIFKSKYQLACSGSRVQKREHRLQIRAIILALTSIQPLQYT